MKTKDKNCGQRRTETNKIYNEVLLLMRLIGFTSPFAGILWLLHT